VRPSIFPETLERTTYSGFPQFFDDAPGTEYRSLAFGLDLGPFRGVRAGAAVESLNIDIPNLGEGTAEGEGVTLAGYVSATLGDNFAIAVEPEWETTESDAILQLEELDTLIVPVTGSFFHSSGFFATATLSYYDQEGVDDRIEFSDQGFVTDAAIGVRLPNERGVISVEFLNLFDAEVNVLSREATPTPQNFGDALLSTPIFAPDFTVFATATLRL
jgi:hypothetical protein